MMAASHHDWDLDCKVYVGGLGEGADKQSLESACGRYGLIRNIWVARNPPGFAFIEYSDPRDAEDAVKGLNDRYLGGRRLRVEKSTGKTRKEVKPWYKIEYDHRTRHRVLFDITPAHTAHRTRSDSRSWVRSRSRSRSCSSRSRSYRRNRRRSRSDSSRDRRRCYRSRSCESSRSRDIRSGNRKHVWRDRDSSDSSCRSSRFSRHSRNSRSRKRSYDHTRREELRSNSPSKRKYVKGDAPNEDNAISEVQLEKGSCNDSQGVRPGISGHQISREATDRDSISVGVQTNYFLMLHYLEREPDVLTETFLRVDRDKILNSSLLPEIIPTVYQRRVIMKTDSEESLNACITGSKSCITKANHDNKFTNKDVVPIGHKADADLSRDDNEEMLDYEESGPGEEHCECSGKVVPVNNTGNLVHVDDSFSHKAGIVGDKRTIVVHSINHIGDIPDKTCNTAESHIPKTGITPTNSKTNNSSVRKSEINEGKDGDGSILVKPETTAPLYVEARSPDNLGEHVDNNMNAKGNKPLYHYLKERKISSVITVATEKTKKNIEKGEPSSAICHGSMVSKMHNTNTCDPEHGCPKVVYDKDEVIVPKQRGKHKVQQWLQNCILHGSERSDTDGKERHHIQNGDNQASMYRPKENKKSVKRDRSSAKSAKSTRIWKNRSRDEPTRQSQSKFDRLRYASSRSSSEDESSSDSITSEKILKANANP